MKDRKRKLELLSFYNHTGIEKHLENMASKGWMIESLSNFGWIYRRIEPAELHFTVTYYPEDMEFTPLPSEGNLTFREFSEHLGWKHVCSWFQMQIFCSDAQNPVPIETDPVIEVETIHRACKANFLRMYWILLVLSGFMGGLFLVSLIQTADVLPEAFLEDPTAMMQGIVWTVLALYCGVELVAYYRWHKQAVKMAEQDIFLDTPSTDLFQKCIMAVVVLAFLWWIGSLLFSADPKMVPIAIAVLASIFGAQILGEKFRAFLRRKGVPAWLNRLLTLLTVFVTVFLATGVIVAVGVILETHLK